MKVRSDKELVGWTKRPILFDVSGDQLGHLKHRHLSLATEDGLKGGVSIDVGLLGCVLETILLDVVPKFLGEFATGSWS